MRNPPTLGAAGAMLNQASKAVIGVSVYVPSVRITITSMGRVLISREHSKDGDRGFYKQIMALEPGTRAVDAATSYPGQTLAPPVQRGVPAPDYVQFVSPNGQRYEAWMAAGQTLDDTFIATFNDTCSQVPGAAVPAAAAPPA